MKSRRKKQEEKCVYGIVAAIAIPCGLLLANHPDGVLIFIWINIGCLAAAIITVITCFLRTHVQSNREEREESVKREHKKMVEMRRKLEQPDEEEFIMKPRDVDIPDELFGITKDKEDE